MDPAGEQKLIERCCEILHLAYVEGAELSGWETQVVSRTSWDGVPEENKNAMRYAMSVLLAYLGHIENLALEHLAEDGLGQ